MKNSIEILKKYNSWRRGDDTKQDSPTMIGIAIDDCILAATRYEFMRTLTPHEFNILWQRNINGEGYFDDLVDKLIAERK